MIFINVLAWTFHPYGGTGSLFSAPIVLTKSPARLDLGKWTGRCRDSLRELGYASVDKFIDDVRGR